MDMLSGVGMLLDNESKWQERRDTSKIRKESEKQNELIKKQNKLIQEQNELSILLLKSQGIDYAKIKAEREQKEHEEFLKALEERRQKQAKIKEEQEQERQERRKSLDKSGKTIAYIFCAIIIAILIYCH